MRERCYWVRDPEVGRVQIPMCYGSAIYGPKGCTCPAAERTPKAERVQRDRQVEALEQRIAELERKLAERVA